MAEVDKNVLRNTYLSKRRTLIPLEFDRRCQLVFHFFQSVDLTEGALVHVFLPIQKNHEVNTWHIIDYLLNKKCHVVVSRSNLQDNVMQHFIYEGKEQLSLNKWGIPEPKHGRQVFSGEIDVVLIPFISFDRRGNRIGYGKGYYDRFLSECRDDVQKIGLAITPPLDLIMQSDDHDIPMDLCVTHLGVYRF